MAAPQASTTYSNATKDARADGQDNQEHIPKELGHGVQKVRQSVNVGTKIPYL